MRALLATVVLLVLAIPGAHAAGRNPRDPPPVTPQVAPEPVTSPGLIAMWLRRLAGHYRIEGSVFMLTRTFEFRAPDGEMREVEFQTRLESARGSGDCKAVGTGAGMHCIFDIGWLDQHETIMDPEQGPVGVFNLPGGVAYLNPSMLLAGLDPGRKGITFLVVDNKGLPEGGSGSIAGDRATLRAPCVNAPNLFQSMNPAAKFNNRPPQTCERITHIDAPAEAAVVHLSISIELNEELVTLTRLTLRRTQPGGDAPADTGRRRR